ncbi:uncharacterized protein LOC119769768 [Culex quinquefasciatus]|uniref:uncharacterized protein LOC119769768 n=1 Tax=Culex quinquefasciatus TaxID=7176 RepID=UPI0018E2C50E|nr:uncharacterized protein LOC119769768 [Culex quinquefasciatus]
MVPLTFFPIVGGFYACLHIFGVLTGIWQLVADLVEEPTTLDVVFTVESIVSFIAHVFLIVGILKENVRHVKAFRVYFLVFVAQLSVLIVIAVLLIPNQQDYFWLEIALFNMVIFGLPIVFLINWILNGIVRYVEHETASRIDLESSCEKQILL